MIIVAGMARNGTTWVARTLSRLLGGEVVNEPFDQWMRPDDDTTLSRVIYGGGTLLPWWGQLQDSASDTQHVIALCRAFTEEQPEAAGIKTIMQPYWGAYREAWPECRIVYVMRGPVGRLVSWVLRGWVEQNIPWGEILLSAPGAQWLWHEYRIHGSCAPAELHLCALMLEANQRHQVQTLPGDALLTEFERLTLEWDLAWRRVAAYVGVTDPDLSESALAPFEWGNDQRYHDLAQTPYTYDQIVDACEQAEWFVNECWPRG